MTERITIEELASRLGVSLETHSWEDLQMYANGRWTDENHTHWEFEEPLVDLPEVDKFTLQMVYDDHSLRDDLWTEWRVMNQGDIWFDALPVEPPDVPNPETTDDAGEWDQCISWHNEWAKYSEMPRGELERILIGYRVKQFTGDGLERDLAAGGSITFRPLSGMTDGEVIKELMGVGDFAPEPTDEQWEIALGLLGDDEVADWKKSGRSKEDIKRLESMVDAMQAIINWHGGTK